MLTPRIAFINYKTKKTKVTVIKKELIDLIKDKIKLYIHYLRIIKIILINKF